MPSRLSHVLKDPCSFIIPFFSSDQSIDGLVLNSLLQENGRFVFQQNEDVAYSWFAD